MKPVTILKSNQEYLDALDRLDQIFHVVDESSPEYKEAEYLAKVIEEFESVHFPIELPTEEGAAQFREEQETLYLVEQIINRKVDCLEKVIGVFTDFEKAEEVKKKAIDRIKFLRNSNMISSRDFDNLSKSEKDIAIFLEEEASDIKYAVSIEVNIDSVRINKELVNLDLEYYSKFFKG